ncbi:hypothetical protein M770_35065 (plasmid) [Pseudomonas aeruginosa VRFPA03]|uniref:hypothetical protein n=1 Tax=Pseudomonas aeruginosa TaxID=287 RepID=UPI0003AC9989|nr:hypothetical protein [Pseudomonas aeruginosa]EQL42700.1 hypothetical protein M770_35065 [Pseudomonas aeruginosa VRFPA03]WPB12759.1 hypothetical protein XM8_contig2_00325 [Pseudomonas aeruginosa]
MGGGQTARRWHGMGQRSADDHAGSEGCGRKPVSSIEAVARTRDDNTAISIIVVDAADHVEAVPVGDFLHGALTIDRYRRSNERIRRCRSGIGKRRSAAAPMEAIVFLIALCVLFFESLGDD